MSNRIIGLMLGAIGGTGLALASAASSQSVGGPPPGAVPGAGPRAQDVAATNRQVDSDYNTLAARGVKVTDKGKAGPPQKKAPSAVPATAEDIKAGMLVRDIKGVQVATVERLEDDGAVVMAGNRLAKLPINAFGKDQAGLMIGITAAEFQNAIAGTSVPVPSKEPEVVAVTAADVNPGAEIRDSEGVPIGTVDKLVDNGVVVLTDGKKVKLALNSFAKDEKGLMIGITASEFKAKIGGSATTKTGG
jgi:hypothetical protein